VASAVEDGVEALGVEQRPHTVPVLGIEGNNALADEAPGPARPNADNATGVALPEVVEGVEPCHAGNTGDEQGQAGDNLRGIDEHAFCSISAETIVQYGYNKRIAPESGA